MDSALTQPLGRAEEHIRNVVPDSSWASQSEIFDSFESATTDFQRKCEQCQDELAFIFSNMDDVSYQSVSTQALLNKWEKAPQLCSAPAMVIVAFERMGITYSEDNYPFMAALVAAFLAEVPNELDYHNNMHFRKVLLHTIRMIVAHNRIFAETQNFLDDSAISKLIIAACIHDLGHQAKGNIIDREYHMALTEKRSFRLALPFLESVGLSRQEIDDISVMVMATDASPIGDPVSPSNQLRRAYEYHFGSKEAVDALELSDEFKVFEQNSDLCLLAMILHEADIMNSAAVSYEITVQESIALSRELNRTNALPEDTLLFLEKICSGQMLSDSARFLGSDNLRDIMAQVLKDFENGNTSYF